MTPTLTDSPQSILSTLPAVVCASSTSTSHSQPPSPTTSSWRRRPSLPVPVPVPEQRRRGSAVSYNTSNSSGTRRAPSLLATAIDVARDAPPASLSGGVVAGGRNSHEEVDAEEEHEYERRQSGYEIDLDAKDKATMDSKHADSPSPSAPTAPATPPRRRRSQILILLFILLWGVILSLDRLLTSSLQTLAANSMSVHSDLAFLSILRSAIAALAGPPFAVLETLAGERASWALGLALYVAGHVVAATTKASGSSSAALAQYALGVSLLELGCNGLLVLQQSLVARISSPRDRALFNLLPQASFVIWAFVSADVFAALDGRWRVGVGMFAVLGPVALLPLIGVLEVEGRRERKRRERNEEEANSKPSRKAADVAAKRPLLHRLCAAITSLIIKADLLGLLLISTATLGILLPIVIAGQGTSARTSWSDARLLAPLLTSTLILLPLLLYWELKIAPNPLLPRQLLTSRTFLLGSSTQLFLFASVGALTTYLPTYLYVAKYTSSKAQQNVSSVFNFSYSLASLPFAVAVRYWRTAKPINVVGAALFTVGVGAMVWTSSSSTPLFGTIAGLVVVGVGGAASVAIVPSVVQVDAQRRQQEARDAKDSSSSSSSSEDDHVIKAVAALNIANCLGSALGAALAGTLWSSLLRTRLTKALAAVSSSSASEVDDVYKQPLTWIASHAVGTGERSAVVLAYDGMWRILIIAATALAAVGVGSVVLMPNLRLGGGENELDEEDRGAKLGLETVEEEEEAGRRGAALPRPLQKAWCRLRGAASR